MYAYFIGMPEAIDQGNLVLEVNKIGYNIKISMKTSDYLHTHPGEIKIYTYTNVREDAILLFGFLTREELNMFKMLITVNGVGPKGALAILDILSVRDIGFAIVAQDAKSLSKASGIGSKTAERIIIDLKDKVSIDDIGSQQNATDMGQDDNPNETEVIEALVSLGYSASDALKVLRQCNYSKEDDVEAILKMALRKISLV